jgi:hypothetical protein
LAPYVPKGVTGDDDDDDDYDDYDDDDDELTVVTGTTLCGEYFETCQWCVSYILRVNYKDNNV